MDRKVITFKQVLFRAFVLFLALIALLAMVFYYQYQNLEKNILDEVALQEKSVLNVMKSDFTQELSFMVADMKLMSELPGVKNFINNPNEQTMNDLKALLLDFATYRTPYDQVRLLDINGREIVRADDNKSKPYIVPDELLQDKSDRGYFVESTNYRPNMVYISQLDLYVDKNVVKVPYIPTIRFALPVFTDKGVRFGLLVVNHLTESLFKKLDNRLTDGGKVVLLNTDGYYLHNQDSPEKAFSFMFPEQQQYQFGNDYPEEWAAIKQQGNGQIQTRNGLFTFSLVSPTEKSFDIVALERINVALQPTFYLIMHYTPQQLNKVLAGKVQETTVTVILSVFLLPVLAAVFAWSSLIYQRQQELLQFNALHDSLTGLPNRILLMDRLTQANRQLLRGGKGFTVIMLDLDNFKTINDELGHEAGDEVLKHVAKSLTESIRTTDTASRIGGDEFIVLATGASDNDGAMRVGNRIIHNLSKPFHYKGTEILIFGSLGATVRWCFSGAPDEIIRSADLAMYKSKEKGKNQIYVDVCRPL